MEAAQREVRAFLADHLSARAMYRVEVVLEEVLMNVALHGHDDDGKHCVDVAVQLGGEAVVLRFEDDGRPFDPTIGPDAHRPSSIDEVRPGGLGLVLLRKSAKALRYTREGTRNRLQVDIDRG